MRIGGNSRAGTELKKQTTTFRAGRFFYEKSNFRYIDIGFDRV